MLPVETTAARPTGTGGGNLSSGVISSSRSEEHTSELQSQSNLVCRLLLEKKKKTIHIDADFSDNLGTTRLTLVNPIHISHITHISNCRRTCQLHFAATHSSIQCNAVRHI